VFWQEKEMLWEKIRLEMENDEMFQRGVQLGRILEDCSNFDSVDLCDILLEHFADWSRHKGDLFDILYEMLDTEEGKSTWKLELRRRRRGNPGSLSDADSMRLFFQYHIRLSELRDQNRASPAELAEKYQMTDEEIRAIVERKEGKRKRRKSKQTRRK
jgi:hypothetical protein